MTPNEQCGMDNCIRKPCRVLIAVRYEALSGLISVLLGRDCGCWVSLTDEGGADVAIVDAADFPRCCGEGRQSLSREKFVVVTPEPGSRYGHAALRNGAGAYVARDDLAEQLLPALRRVAAQRLTPTATG